MTSNISPIRQRSAINIRRSQPTYNRSNHHCTHHVYLKTKMLILDLLQVKYHLLVVKEQLNWQM